MAKLNNSVRRLNVDDYPPASRDLITKLAYTLNPFLDNLVNALSNNLTIADNLNAQIIDVDITAPIDPNSPIVIKSSLKTNCTGTMVLAVSNKTNPLVLLTSAPFVEFQQDNSNIKLTNVTGLVAANKYSVRILLLGG